MSDPLKVRGEAPFPEAGGDLFLFFRNSELAILEQERGGQWFPKIVDEFLKGDISLELVTRLTRMGVKRRDEHGKRVSVSIDDDVFDEVPVAILAERIFDALCYAMHGQPAKQYVQERLNAYLEALENNELSDPSPLSPDTPSSLTSEESVSGPE